MNELSQKAVSAFVVKDVRDTSQQRQLFEVLMRFTKEHQIPVLELPENIYYWAVIKHVLLRINNLETAKLTYFKITHDNIDKAYFDSGSGNRGHYYTDRKSDRKSNSVV